MAKRAVEEGIKEKIREKEMEEVARVVEQEKREKLAVKQREMEELQREIDQAWKDCPKKKKKRVDEAKGADGEPPLVVAAPKAAPSAQMNPTNNFSVHDDHPGRGRGRGGWRHDHGGFRPNHSVEQEEIARRYRDRTQSLVNMTFLSTASASTSFNPNMFVAGLCFLGSQSLGLGLQQPAAPVAATLPDAGQQQQGRDRGGDHPRSNNNNSNFQSQRGGHHQGRQQHHQQQAAPQLTQQRGGGRGAAPPRQ